MKEDEQFQASTSLADETQKLPAEMSKAITRIFARLPDTPASEQEHTNGYASSNGHTPEVSAQEETVVAVEVRSAEIAGETGAQSQETPDMPVSEAEVSEVELEEVRIEASNSLDVPRETRLLPAFRLRFLATKKTSDDPLKRIRSYDEAPHVAARVRRRRWRLPFPRDGWLVAVIGIAFLTSVLSLWYFFQNHQTLLYGDAYAHMLIARRLFDNITPGFAQLGGIWLPLPHLAMVPFIWNRYLWETGLAGSLVSMLCYLIATIYLFLAARRLTRSSLASFVGALVFVLNPNILYLQTTPLSELVLLATMAASCYYFLAWAQADQPKYLILAAGATFLATLARYDGWALFLALLVLIPVIEWLKRSPWVRAEGYMVIFGSLGGLGIVLWFVWCGIIFGDPLYFQRGPFSAQAQQRELINAHLLYTYHDLAQAIRYYVIDCIDTLGPILCVLLILAVVTFVVQRRITPETLAALAFLVPIPYYMFSLYSGQASLYLPEAVPGYSPYQIFNARYGVMVVPAVALFMAFLASTIPLISVRWLASRLFTRLSPQNLSRFLGPLICVVIIIAQSLLVVSGGIITLRDGQYGLACTPTHTIVIYLAEHYAGGGILEDLYTSKIDALEPAAGIDFKNIVYEGSGNLWTKALSNPASVADWVIVNPDDAGDYLAKKLDLAGPAFAAQFTFILQEPTGLTLYHRNGLPPLPWRSVPRSMYTEHSLCTTHNRGQAGTLPLPVVGSADLVDIPHTSRLVEERE